MLIKTNRTYTHAMGFTPYKHCFSEGFLALAYPMPMGANGIGIPLRASCQYPLSDLFPLKPSIGIIHAYVMPKALASWGFFKKPHGSAHITKLPTMFTPNLRYAIAQPVKKGGDNH